MPIDPKTVAIAKRFISRVGLAAARGAAQEVQRSGAGAAVPVLQRVEAVGQHVLATLRAAREALDKARGGAGGEQP